MTRKRRFAPDGVYLEDDNYCHLDGLQDGQTVHGGVGANEDLTLRSTSDATKGDVLIADDGGFVGVGTVAPEASLHVRTVNNGILLERIDTGILGPIIELRKARGSFGAETVVVAGDSVFSFQGRGYTGAAYQRIINLRCNAQSVAAGVISGSFTVRLADTAGVLQDRLFIDEAGRVATGTSSPATSAALDVRSTTGALIVPRMTTVQRNALTAVNGMIIYNTTTNAFNFYENSAWVTGSGLV